MRGPSLRHPGPSSCRWSVARGTKGMTRQRPREDQTGLDGTRDPSRGFLGSPFPTPAPGRRFLPAVSRQPLGCPLAARPSTRRRHGELQPEPAAQLTISREAWRSERR